MGIAQTHPLFQKSGTETLAAEKGRLWFFVVIFEMTKAVGMIKKWERRVGLLAAQKIFGYMENFFFIGWKSTGKLLWCGFCIFALSEKNNSVATIHIVDVKKKWYSKIE